MPKVARSAPLVAMPFLPLGQARNVVGPVLVVVLLLLAAMIFMSGFLIATIITVVVFILLELVNLLICAS